MIPTRPCGTRVTRTDCPGNHHGRSRSRRSARSRFARRACQRHDATVGRISAATVSHSGFRISSFASFESSSTSAAINRPNRLAHRHRSLEPGSPIREGLVQEAPSGSAIDGTTGSTRCWVATDVRESDSWLGCVMFVFISTDRARFRKPSGSGFVSFASVFPPLTTSRRIQPHPSTKRAS